MTIREPMMVPMATISFSRPVWRVSEILSRSLVTRLRISPALFWSKEAQGQPVELPGHLGAQGEHQALRHAGHQIGLEVVKQPGEQVLGGELHQLRGPWSQVMEKGVAARPGGLDALPQPVDDDGAVHGVPDAQGHIDDDGDDHHGQPDPLALQLGEQPRPRCAGRAGGLPAGKFLLALMLPGPPLSGIRRSPDRPGRSP